MKRPMAAGVFCFLIIVLAAGCNDGDEPQTDDDASIDDGSNPAEGGGEADDGGAVGLPELGSGWSKVETGGGTICSRGDEYFFWVRGGSVNKLLLMFDGGGACWDAVTCSVADAIFEDEPDENFNPQAGIANVDNPENPFKDWYGVFIPYCTGDVHWGDNVKRYEPPAEGGEQLTIYHKGFVNGSAVLDWVYENFERPDTIFVTGCSAGSYGSIAFAPYIMKHYRHSEIYQLGDSGAGVITEQWFLQSFPAWNAQSNLAPWLTELANEPLEDLDIIDVYAFTAKAYPEHIFSQYNTNNDENQRFYYDAMGGAEQDWSANMRNQVREITDRTPNFRHYTAWGELHCILPFDQFYTYQVNGVRLRDWVNDMVNGEDVPNVSCTDCTGEELYEP